MSFIFTSEDAQPTATRIITCLRRAGYRIEIEKALDENAPYRTTLIVRKNRHAIYLIDVHPELRYTQSIRELNLFLAKERKNCELYIALDSNTKLAATMLTQLKKDGIGVLIIDENNKLDFHQKAKNFSLVVKPDPNLTFGSFSGQVWAAVQKFNDVDRKDGLRDLCEVFESAIEGLGLKLCKEKKFKTLTEEEFKRKDLIERIDVLSADNAYQSGSVAVDYILKADLHSFRNARNLVDHPSRTNAEEIRRQAQYADKMMMGPRLIHEIEKIRRSIR